MNVGRDHATAVLSQHQKYHKAHQVALQLATVASEVGAEEFEARLQQLKLLRDKWSNGESVLVTLATSSNSSNLLPYDLFYVSFQIIL